MDRISNLPDNVVELILESLPIYDAARTSVLSKRWRYRWAALSTLTLDYVFFDTMYRQRRKPPRTMYVSLVKTILIQHIGPLRKFVIYIPDLDLFNMAEINLMICFALRNGVQELTVMKAWSALYGLPSFLFSCPKQLTKLELQHCAFDPPHEFSGFPNLKSFCLNSIRCCNLDKFSSFISSCPKLRRIQLDNLNHLDQNLCIHCPRLEELSIGGRFRSISLKEVHDLVSLYIHMVDINEDIEQAMDSSKYVLDLFSNLSKIKYLKLGGYTCRLLGAGCVLRKLSAELHCLKTMEVVEVDLGHIVEFHCLLCFVRSSPNLQSFELRVIRDTDAVEEPDFLSDSGGNFNCCLQHLRTVRISNLRGTKSELKIIEILLGCSPALELMSVKVDTWIDDVAMAEVSQKLTQFRCVSPMAEISCTSD